MKTKNKTKTKSKSKVISISMTSDLLKKVTAHCKANKISRSKLITQSIKL